MMLPPAPTPQSQESPSQNQAEAAETAKSALLTHDLKLALHDMRTVLLGLKALKRQVAQIAPELSPIARQTLDQAEEVALRLEIALSHDGQQPRTQASTLH